MKKIFTLSILFVIVMIFSETVEAQQYIKTIKDTKSYNGQSYNANHLFDNEVDSAASCYIHIIKAKSKYANGGVGDSTMFLITTWSDEIKNVCFKDTTQKTRNNVHEKAEILVKVGEDYFLKEDIAFIDKSVRDSVLDTQSTTACTDTVSGKVIVDDISSSKTDLCSLIVGIVVGIIIAIIIIVIIIFAPTKRKKKEYSGAAENSTNYSSTHSSNPKKEENGELQVSERKLTWKEKIGCHLAIEYLEDLKKKKQKIQAQKDELEKNIQELKEELYLTQGKLTQKEQDYKNLKDIDLPNAKKEASKEGRDAENKVILEKIKGTFKENFKDLKDTMNLDEAFRILADAIKKYKTELNETQAKATKELQNAQKEVNRQKSQNEQDYNNRKKELEDSYLKKEHELLSKVETENRTANEKQQLAEQKLNEAQQRFEDADIRVKQIEATEKGELFIKLKQTEDILNKNHALLAERDRQFEQLQKDLANVKEQVESLKGDLKKEQDSHNATKQEWRDKVEGMRTSHRSELKTKDEEHADNIKNIKDVHQTEINNIKANHSEELKKMEDSHRSDIEKEQAKAKAKEEELKDIISAHKSSIENLENNLQAEADILRAEAEQATQHLFEFLKDNEIMVACDDDYKDKVEEKLQDVVYEAKQMCQLVKDMPKVQSPSEWIKILTDYFVEQIDKNTSLLNRLLKYYAMSNVPFMIDSERDNGIYFVRKNMTQAYDYIASLLAQCGIIPIIPSAFVENKDEGLYEIEGQFNDIESFCPGNMSEHIGHIERGTDGLSGVIIGITRVGYIIKNKKIIKAQVITQ